MFMHAAVCRDMLEPATASFAHRKIGLPGSAQIFDVSNACLGFLNSFVILAGMIESGQIQAGMVVAGENGRPLIEQTLNHLATAPLNRNEIKPFFANLTIGSGAVAAILCHRSLVKGRAHRLIGGAGRAMKGAGASERGWRIHQREPWVIGAPPLFSTVPVQAGPPLGLRRQARPASWSI